MFTMSTQEMFHLLPWPIQLGRWRVQESLDPVCCVVQAVLGVGVGACVERSGDRKERLGQILW
jgi:hypothetical protein